MVKYFNNKVILSALILFLSFLPACRRVQLKQLPPIPARQDNKVHIEAHALDNKETNDYLGFDFGQQSPLCVWHVIAYNPTFESLFITPNSWSIDPSSLDELQPCIRKHYWYYLPIGLTTATGISSGFAYLSYTNLTTPAFNFIVGIGQALSGISSAVAGAVTLIAVPLITYYSLNKKITAHTEALILQLFPIEGVVPAQSKLQGIVILPKETLIEPWQLQLFDQHNTNQTFTFKNHNTHA
jgi:hypothetical protein